MGRSRYIENAIDLGPAEKWLLYSLYTNKQALANLDSRTKRTAIDALLKATNYTSFRAREEENGVSFPVVSVAVDSTSFLIEELAKSIVVDGTLSLWDTKSWHVQALTAGNLNQLENLNLGNCHEEDLQQLTGKTPELKRFRTRLPHCQDVNLFLNFLSGCPKLEVLCVNTDAGRKENFLSRTLARVPNLKVLKMSNLELSEDDFQALKERVVQGTLNTVDFTKISMPRQECWAELLEAGKDTLQGFVLQSDYLRYYGATEEQASLNKRVCEALLQCTNLRHVHLNDFRLAQLLNDEQFNRLLCNNPNLKEVRGYTLFKLTDASLRSMAEHGKQLNRIYLHQTAMSWEGVDQFAQNHFWKRPEAEFISISGDHLHGPEHVGAFVRGLYCYVRRDCNRQFNLSDSHRRYWDIATTSVNI